MSKEVCRIIESSINTGKTPLSFKICDYPKSGYEVRWNTFTNLVKSFDPGETTTDAPASISFRQKNGHRAVIKIGRFLTTKLNLKEVLTDKEIEDVSVRILAEIEAQKPKIRLDTGNQIYKNYLSAVGGSSCMAGERSKAKKVGLYCINPDRFSQLIMQVGRCSARAIVHKLDNGKQLLDRIYTDNSSLLEKMRSYAIENDWYFRGEGSSGQNVYKKLLKSNHEITPIEYMELIVSRIKFINGEIPYCDCLKCGTLEKDGKNHLLTIFHPKSYREYTHYLESQHGTIVIESENTVRCGGCNNSFPDNRLQRIRTARRSNFFCSSCIARIFSTCFHCGTLRDAEDCHYYEGIDGVICDGCFSDSYHACIDCDAVHHNDNMHYIESIDDWVCESCLEDYFLCPKCDRWERNRYKCKLNIDGIDMFICHDCYSKATAGSNKGGENVNPQA